MKQHGDRFIQGGPALSVVIPTHNRSGILRTTLERLCWTTLGSPWEVVVVANACTDDTACVVAEVASTAEVPVRLVEEGRASASVARNRGAHEASGSLLVFLDDDILLEPDGLEIILDWYRASDGCSHLVGQVLPLPEHSATPFGAFRHRVLGGVSPQCVPADVDWFASGLAAVPAAALERLGGYAESYPAAGLEDADFAIRARRAGQRIVFHPSVKAVHNDWAGTTAQDYCRRAAKHCSTAPLLAQRFPDDDHPWGRLVQVNRPPGVSDPPGVRAQKRLKQAAVAMSADRWLPVLADRVVLPVHGRELLYRASISLAMFAGYQRGLASMARVAEVAASRDDGSVHLGHDLSIVIVTYNCGDEAERTLEALRRHPPSVDHEIVVIDNASQDGTVTRMRSLRPDVKVIALDENIGYGAAVNLAVKETDGAYLLLLNPDTETTAGAIDTLLALLSSGDRVGIVGPRLLLGTGLPQPSARRLPSPWRMWFEVLRLHLLLPGAIRSRLLAGTYSTQDQPGRVDWISGACHLMPRSVWDKVGGLTERTFCGSDDLDYCWRARDAGLETWFCPDAVVVHHCGVSVSRRWTPDEVESIGIHNTYVVLGEHWSRARLKVYCAAELAGTFSDLLLGVRRGGSSGVKATVYRRAARSRMRLLCQLLLGRLRPIERHEPVGRQPYGTAR